MADTAEASAPVETPGAEPETTSLADHAALYGPADPTLEGEAKAQNEDARAKVRHRAQSQQAGPEDVGRIAQLTKRLRETEAERDALKAQPAQTSPARADQSPPSAPSYETGAARQAATPQTRERPSADEIGTKYDTYEAYVEDLADWKYEQRDAARQAKEQEAQQARQQSEAQQSWHKAHQTYVDRMKTFAADHADFPDAFPPPGSSVPPAPYIAVLSSPDGPAWIYHLHKHPDQFAELALLFDGKAPTSEMVAHATRWLSSRAKAEAAPAPAPVLTLAPRPPSPVKTGAPHAEPAPDGEMSIEAHEKQFLKRRR